MQRGINVLWLNGQQIDVKDVHPFGLLRLLKKERAVMQSLTSQGLQPSQAFQLLTHSAIAATQKDSGMMGAVFDASDRPEGEDIIVWWNDMEKDKRYVDCSQFGQNFTQLFLFLSCKNRYARWNPSLYAVCTEDILPSRPTLVKRCLCFSSCGPCILEPCQALKPICSTSFSSWICPKCRL